MKCFKDLLITRYLITGKNKSCQGYKLDYIKPRTPKKKTKKQKNIDNQLLHQYWVKPYWHKCELLTKGQKITLLSFLDKAQGFVGLTHFNFKTKDDKAVIYMFACWIYILYFRSICTLVEMSIKKKIDNFTIFCKFIVNILDTL